MRTVYCPSCRLFLAKFSGTQLRVICRRCREHVGVLVDETGMTTGVLPKQKTVVR